MKYLNLIQFIIYFVVLHVKIYFGFHTTAFPTTLSWRYRHWEQIQKNRGSAYPKKA